MSYTGSDDLLLCDGGCDRMHPPGWPDMITVASRGAGRGPDGRMTRDYASSSGSAWTALQCPGDRSR